jgi:hypothetical protein
MTVIREYEDLFNQHYQTCMNRSLCNLAGYVIELPEDDVLTSNHVGAME